MSDGSIVIDTRIDNDGASKGIGKLSSLAKGGLKAVGVSILAVGTALVGLGAYATKVGMEFEAGMSKVGAISGATAGDMEKLADKAKEMGATTKFSATESADALSFMALAGWKTTDMLNGLPGIMNLAAASGEDLAATSDIVTDSLTAFGMKASDSAHFADVLAKASSNSNTNVAMLGESFKYVAPLAGSLGYSLEDTTVALGLMANSGIKASQSGTSLKTALVNMAKPTAKMKKVMDEYDLSLSNADGTMKPLSQVTEELRTKLGGLDKATQAAASATLFGKESLAGMLAVVNASPGDYEKLTGAINNADGAAQSMADTMNDNLKGQFTLLKSAAEGLGIQLYESIDNPMKDIAKSANGMLGELSKAFTEGGFAGLTESLGGVFAQIITGIATYAPQFVSSALLVIQSLVTGIQNNLPMIIQSALQIVTSLVTGIIQMLPQLLQMGITILVELIKGIAQMLPTLIPLAIETILTLVDTLINNIDLIIDAGIELIIGLAEGLIVALPILIEKIPIIIEKLLTAIANNLPKLVEMGIKLIFMLAVGLIKAIPQLVSKIPQIIGAIISAFISYYGKMLKMGTDLMGKVKDGLISKISQFADIGGNIVKGVWEGIKGLGGWLASKVGNFFGGIVDGAKKALGIHSPSRIFRDQVGAMMAKGVGVGFEDESENIEDKMKNNLSDLTAKMKSTVDFETASTTARVVAKHDYASNQNGSSINESDNKSTIPTIIAKLIVDGKEFTQTVVAPHQEVLTDFYKGR